MKHRHMKQTMKILTNKVYRLLFMTGFNLLVLVLAQSTVWAQLGDTDIAIAQHLGVASCASSVCHGSVQPNPNGRIQQNEFITWQTDRHGNMHAKAYDKLLTPEAIAIAAKLKLGKPEQAEACLICHADYVPEQQRGSEFQLSDGIGCETCHGGAEHYIVSHKNRNLSLAEKQQDGLHPTWQPQVRAELCLSCHMGDGQRSIDHRIMGAGHPRLQFELDTFTYLQPHHVVDEDYIERKGRQNNARDWAVGQALAADNLLGQLQDTEQGWHGIFVEPLLLDCHSCHKRLDGERWQRRSGTGLGPGEMRLNDANLVMVRLIMSAIDPALAEQLKQQTLALHQSTTISRERVHANAKQLQQTLAAATTELINHQFASGDLDKVFAQLQQEAQSGELSDYAAAEQSAMAVVNLVSALEQSGVIEAQVMDAEIDGLFATVADEYEYRSQRFARALQKFNAAIKKH